MSAAHSIRRGPRLSRTWEGEDSAAEFWPYAAAVFVGFMVIGNVCFVAGFIATFNASQDTRMIVLLAVAAVTRRLRDRGCSLTWAVAPLVLLVAAGGVQAAVLLTVEQDSGPGLFLVAFALTVVYFAAVVALLVQLALPARRTSS